ncbi:uncharacterized protein [Procambarus clarkii]|uniref:uncharacterized protein isoform X2 n=1 Tax=Procambarus clarkii TaxID=6728 RepID=UPI001E675C17|nr:zinc finger protein 37-like isoform X2 [Procambarus clarkii]
MAQADGQVVKYELEVVVSAWQPSTPHVPSYSSAFHSALLSLLHVLQEISNRCSSPGLKVVNPEARTYSPQLQSSDTNVCHNLERMYASEVQCENHLPIAPNQQHPIPVEYIIKDVSNEHIPDSLVKRLSPQQPTTKETEAANVLMNLSGKAADRTNQTRLDSGLSTYHELTIPDVSKSSLYLLSSGTLNSKCESNIIKREYSLCDEVPQINEKDLLPLATQVLCQYCSQQCEDLVELHEHVLAMHNVPETETPLMPSNKKVKNLSEDDDEFLRRLSDGKKQKQDKIESKQDIEPKQDAENQIKECSKDSAVVLPTSTSSDVQLTKNKQYTEEKKLKRKQKLKKESKPSSSWIIYEVSDHPNCSLGEESEQTKSYVKECKNSPQMQNTPGSELPTYSSHEHFVQESTTPEARNDNFYDKDEEWLKHNSGENITELTPVGNDALAMAIESSQIRVIEAKVTIYVCVKCSSGYTDAQEFKDHICHASRPLVQTCADGSVTLACDTSVCEDRIQLPESNMWYFPEFCIRRPAEDEKSEIRGLQIIHNPSGRRILLHTHYQPAYLSEQLISFRCPTCENDSDSLGRFLEHLTKGPCMFWCPECKLVYITQDKLQKHRASLHPSLEDRTCPNCCMVFEKRHQRNRHLRTKCSQRHICVICGGVLKNEYNLRVHMQSHEERTHVCSECGAAFHRRQILTRHMMRHSGKKPHACSQCDAKFYTRQHLKTHMDRHSGFRRFPCSSCNKAYYSKHDRDTHYSKVHCKVVSGQKSLVVHKQKLENEHIIE